MHQLQREGHASSHDLHGKDVISPDGAARLTIGRFVTGIYPANVATLSLGVACPAGEKELDWGLKNHLLGEKTHLMHPPKIF